MTAKLRFHFLVISTGFRLLNDDNTFILEDDKPVIVRISYTNDTATQLYGILHTGETIAGSLNTGERTGEINVTSDNVSEHGAYHLNLTLITDTGQISIESVIYYEESISGFEVIYDSEYVVIGEEVVFNVSLTTGSNVFIEWYIEEDKVLWHDYPGQLRQVNVSYTFQFPFSGNIRVIAANRIGNSSKLIPVTAQHLVTEFSIPLFPVPVNTTKQTYFDIKLNSSAPLPMGNVKVAADFGYQNNTAKYDLDNMNDIQLNGFTISHKYASQGNFTATFIIYAELNSLNISVDVYVWDAVDCILRSDKQIANVSWPILFYFEQVQTFGFEYLIEYGDGRVKRSPDEVLNYPVNTSSWTHDYSDEGEYNITMTAWNPFYFRFCSFTVFVEHPIPDGAVKLSPENDEIPIPDGIMTYTLSLEQEVPSPTNVLCEFDFGELAIETTTLTTEYNTVSYVKESTTADQRELSTETDIAMTGSPENSTISGILFNEISQYTSAINYSTTSQFTSTMNFNKTSEYISITSNTTLPYTSTEHISNSTMSPYTSTMNLSETSDYTPTMNFMYSAPETTTIPLPSAGIRTHLAYGTPIMKIFYYSTPGEKNINFTCYNNVSKVTKTAYVRIRNFTLEDFTVSFPDKVMMNMTLTLNKDGNPIIGSDGVIVDFFVSLFACSKFPPGIELFWEFGDGETDGYSTVRFLQSHLYKKRQKYAINIYIRSQTGTTYKMPKMSILLGVAQFTVNKNYGLIGISDEFMFSITGPSTPCDYFIYFDMASQTKLMESVRDEAVVYFTYSKLGEYMPFIIVRSSDFYERLYLRQQIKTDYELSSLTVEFSNTTLLMPPGDIVLTVSVMGPPLPMVTCAIDMGDFIDIEVKYITQNITIEDPIVFHYQYLTFGSHPVIVNCSNLVDGMDKKEIINIINPCFSYRGIFAWQFSRPRRPLIISTAVQTDLSNRMSVRCYDKNPQFEWKIYKYEKGFDSNYSLVENSVKRSKGTYRYYRASMEPGSYKVTLNVTLEGTWAIEDSYILFTRPSPYAFIKGGEQRTVFPGLITIDAKSESYSAERGFGYTDSLNFTFFCFRFAESTFQFLHQHYLSMRVSHHFESSSPRVDISEDANCVDSLSHSSPGVVLLNTSDVASYRGYLIVVRVDEAYTTPSISMQMIAVKNGKCPVVTIRCEMNCKDKVAVQSALKMEALCENCNSTDVISSTYNWTLKKQKADYSYDEVLISQDHTDKNTPPNVFVLSENVLEEGQVYIVHVDVSSPSYQYTGHAGISFKTNYKPYGGYCDVKPDTGFGMLTSFDVTCHDWKDEGIREQRNVTLDLDEPLMFEYSQEIKRIVGGNIKTIRSPLFRGNEDSATELRLQIGDEAFDYMVTIVVRVQDFFGDFYEYRDITVRVARNDSLVPRDEHDLSTLDLLFEMYRDNFLPLEGGGNQIALAQFVGSTGAMLASINGSESGNSSMNALLTDKISELIHALRGTVSLKSNEALNSADSYNVIENVKACLSNLNIVNDSVLEVGLHAAGILADKLQNLTNIIPFPVEDLENLLDSASGTIDIVDSALAAMIPENLVDTEEDITLESIRSKYNKDYPPSNGSLTEEEEAERELIIQQLYTNAITLQNVIRERSKTAKSAVPTMMTAMENAQNVIGGTLVVGESAKTIERDNVIMTVEKFMPDSNKTMFNRTNLELEVDNIADSINSSAAQIQTAVFNKIPQYHGKGASTLTSKGIMVSVKNSDGTRANINMTLKISNEGVAYSKKYQPLYLPDDPDQMLYFLFYVLSYDDAVIIYIQPDNFDPSDFSSYGLYDVYVRYNDYPSTSNYQWKHSMTIRDWVNADFGFKIFIPQNILRAGPVYVALKPLPAPPELKLDTHMRKRRSTHLNETSTSTNTSAFEPADVNFTMVIVTTGCRTWNEEGQIWTTSQCSVLPFSTLNETVCRCPEATENMFATTFFVQPNTIDFNAVWSKFDPHNASVYGTLICLLAIYVLLCVWARRQDRKDTEKWTTRFLCDSDKDDDYFYIISVHTGLRKGSGTKADVRFELHGEHSDTGVRILRDQVYKGFENGTVKTFFMGTTELLGELLYLRIWCENLTDETDSWYLHKITIDDLQQKIRYVFLCEDWLFVDHGDGLMDRILPVCGRDNLTKFSALFSQHIREGFTDNHLWVSVFMRPAKSSFTRVQRISCLVMLLFLTMITNAMFFKSDKEDSRPKELLALGFLKLSLPTIYISMISIFITTVPVVFVALLFLNYKQKPVKPPKSAKKAEEEDVLSDHRFYTTDKSPLPTFTMYIAWALIGLAVLLSSFFLLLYSMEWGKVKSEEWLSTFIFSFFESFLLVDPVKVIFVATIFAVIFKHPFDKSLPKVNLEEVRKVSRTLHGMSIRTFECFRDDILHAKEAQTEEERRQIRSQRENEKKATECFLEIILYIVYILIAYSISYINRDHRSFLLKDHLHQTLTSESGQFGYKEVSNASGYMKWLNDTFFSSYFPLHDYRGIPLGVRDQFYFSDLANAKIGPPRLRQVRMKRGKCPYPYLNRNRDCISPYNLNEEDEISYCVGWRDQSSSECNSRNFYSMDAWRYQPSQDIWGTPITGELATYEGGGYILKLENGLENSVYIAEELMRYKWINRETRAVFLELTLYNANINLFLYVVFLTEFTETGGLLTRVDMYPFRPYQHTGALGAFAIICYLIYMAALVYSTVKLIRKAFKQRLRFLLSMWNIADLFCAVLGYVAVVLWCLRYVYTTKSMAVYYDNKDAFINFQHVVIWDLSFNVLMGTIVFVATVRLLKIMGYQKRMKALSCVISNAAGDLIGFAMVFGIAYFAWVILGFLLFGSSMYSYRSIFSSTGSLCNSLIGKNKLDTMVRVAPNFANLYYFTYVLFVMLILMTMFAVILNQSISDVKCNMAKVPEKFGITDLLKKHITGLLGMVFKLPTKRRSKSNNLNKYHMSHEATLPGLDTANIIRTVRDIFGNTWIDKMDKNERKTSVTEDLFLDLQRYKENEETGLSSLDFQRCVDKMMCVTSELQRYGESRKDTVDFVRNPPTLKEGIYSSFL